MAINYKKIKSQIKPDPEVGFRFIPTQEQEANDIDSFCCTSKKTLINAIVCLAQGMTNYEQEFTIKYK